MAKITLNLAEIADSFEPVPGGTYRAMIDDAVVRMGKRSNHPYLNLGWKVLQGDHAGRKLFLALSLQQQALWRVKQVFRSLGLDTDSVCEIESDDTTGKVYSPELEGLVADLVVGMEEYTNSDGVPAQRNVILDVIGVPAVSGGFR